MVTPGTASAPTAVVCGEMANCPHGFPQDECMICRTLGAAPTSPKGRAKAGAAAATRTAEPLAMDMDMGPTAAPLATRRQPQASGAKRSPGHQALLILGVLVVGGLCLWIFSGLFTLAFHIGEFVAVALVAGWLGYRMGHFRGRRGH